MSNMAKDEEPVLNGPQDQMTVGRVALDKKLAGGVSSKWVRKGKKAPRGGISLEAINDSSGNSGSRPSLVEQRIGDGFNNGGQWSCRIPWHTSRMDD
jgi:hypothetical protein